MKSWEMMSTNQEYIVEKVGVFTTKPIDINEINTGEIGFITTGIKDISETKSLFIIEIISPEIMSDSVVVATATNINPTSPLGDIPIPMRDVFKPLPIAPRADTYLPTNAKRLTSIPYKNTSREAKV